MMKKMMSVAVAALLMSASAVFAGDAVLEGFTGKVLVDTGGDYKDPVLNMELNKGDRIMAMEGSEAVIKYSNGCKETIVGSKIVTIDEPCKAAVVAGSAGSAAALLAGSQATIPAVLGAGAGVIAILDNGGDGRPASP